MTYKDLQEALQILRLEQRCSLKEIKARHRELVKRHHPDTDNADGDAIRRINAAHRTVLEYIADYRFSFSEAEFYEQNPDERLRQQFMDTPMWGDR